MCAYAWWQAAIGCMMLLAGAAWAICDATAQRAILSTEVTRLRSIADSDHVVGCTGVNQKTCDAPSPFHRKSCQRRRCSSEALGFDAPKAFAHESLSSIRSRVANELQIKLQVDGSVVFLASDYNDFVVYNMLFRGIRGGVFAEAGGVTGLDESNTFFFEQSLGWTGLLVEPSLCAKCNIPVNRPRSHVYHGAICTKAQAKKGVSSAVATGMNSFCTSATGSTPGEETAAVASSNQSRREQTKLSNQHLPCSGLTSIFEEHNMTRIDFFSLDVEGFVGMALSTLNFSKIDISALLVECRRESDVQLLKAAGYAVINITSRADGYRGYMGDFLAWKPHRWQQLCAKHSRSDNHRWQTHSRWGDDVVYNPGWIDG